MDKDSASPVDLASDCRRAKDLPRPMAPRPPITAVLLFSGKAMHPDSVEIGSLDLDVCGLHMATLGVGQKRSVDFRVLAARSGELTVPEKGPVAPRPFFCRGHSCDWERPQPFGSSHPRPRFASNPLCIPRALFLGLKCLTCFGAVNKTRPIRYA